MVHNKVATIVKRQHNGRNELQSRVWRGWSWKDEPLSRLGEEMSKIPLEVELCIAETNINNTVNHSTSFF